MFVDLNTYTGPSAIDADICVVGAGAAGIAIALELDGNRRNVCILESGTFRYEPKTQALAEGDIVGLPYYPLRTARLRYFGGSTNHWNGTTRPLDPVDFEARREIPYSGWPITRQSLDDYYERAHPYFLRRNDYALETWSNRNAPVLTDGFEHLDTSIMLNHTVRFAHEFRARLEDSRNISVFLAANVTELECDADGQRVDTVHARTLDGKSLSVRAPVVIVAAGAIENPRLLLTSNRIHRSGIGNRHDLVGRFFMEHPLAPVMDMQMADPHPLLTLYTGRRQDGIDINGYFTPRPDVLRREGLLNACALLTLGGANQRIAKSLTGVRSGIVIWNSLKEGRLPAELGNHVGNILSDFSRLTTYSYERAFAGATQQASLVIQLEQAPNPDSRVTLADETDALGLRKASLDWRMGELDRRSIERLAELMAADFGAAGLGRVRLLPQDDDGWWPGMRGSWHHMGTTRMHSDRTQGVVDADCRVHGIDNLYIAGSSVFTTGGFANPTLTIVALAIRLADHVKGLDP